MTYYINVNKAKEQDFQTLMETLKSMGVLDSFESTKSLAKEGEVIDVDFLLQVLERSKQEAEEGKSYSLEELRGKIEEWKNQK